MVHSPDLHGNALLSVAQPQGGGLGCRDPDPQPAARRHGWPLQPPPGESLCPSPSPSARHRLQGDVLPLCGQRRGDCQLSVSGLRSGRVRVLHGHPLTHYLPSGRRAHWPSGEDHPKQFSRLTPHAGKGVWELRGTARKADVSHKAHIR